VLTYHRVAPPDGSPRFDPGMTSATPETFAAQMRWLAGHYRVVDPAVAYNEVQNYLISLYSYVQVALREVVGAKTIDDVLQHREAIGPEVLERSVSKARAIGVELTEVDVKDVMLPGPTKRLLAQVVEARQQGLAALERARGETAALRSLANAASMLEDKPALLQLRMLHQLETTSGNTVVLGLSPTAVPLSPAPKSASGDDESGSSSSG